MPAESEFLFRCYSDPMLKKISPVAWRHVHLNGHYTFRSTGQLIDLDVIVAGLNLD